MLGGWLASLSVSASGNYICFGPRYLKDMSVISTGLFRVSKDGSSEVGTVGLPIIPVVTLKSNIKIENTGSYTETATGTATATATGAYAERLGEHNVWSIK